MPEAVGKDKDAAPGTSGNIGCLAEGSIQRARTRRPPVSSAILGDLRARARAVVGRPQHSTHRETAAQCVVGDRCTARSNGGRNNFPVSVGTGGMPGASPVHIAGSEATLRGVWPASPRCSPAWDGVQDQSESTEKSVASPPRCLPAWSGVHGDRRSDRDEVWSGTWPHAGKQRGDRRVRGAGRCLVLNTAPR